MSWLLAVLAAAGAVYFLWRARRQADASFGEVLRARKRAEEKRAAKPKGGGVDRKA